ncbi:hypothetical protein B5M45_23950 [Mycobacterium simiae]|uniref:DUF3349 domain-containing protein n=1 Tax=Mycobacterium simiae TaxID=1784 RepID=A0A1X0XSY0_MYCSI|nr:hypothetical protein B5M45_23950 [Mycobacterium simiae]
MNSGHPTTRGPRRGRETRGVSEQHSPKRAKFLRSVIRWLDVGYPQGVPGPDQVALFALLRSTPLTEDQLEEVAHKIAVTESQPGADGVVSRDEIAEFITKVTRHDPGRENIQRVAATLAAAGWPLAGIDVSEVIPGDEHGEAAEEIACRRDDVPEGASQG